MHGFHRLFFWIQTNYFFWIQTNYVCITSSGGLEGRPPDLGFRCGLSTSRSLGHICTMQVTHTLNCPWPLWAPRQHFGVSRSLGHKCRSLIKWPYIVSEHLWPSYNKCYCIHKPVQVTIWACVTSNLGPGDLFCKVVQSLVQVHNCGIIFANRNFLDQLELKLFFRPLWPQNEVMVIYFPMNQKL